MSDNGTLFFTPEQLRYLLDKRLKQKKKRNIYYNLYSLLLVGIVLHFCWTLSPEIRLPVLLIASLIVGYYSWGFSGMQSTLYNERYNALKEAALFGLIVIIGSPVFVFSDFRGLTIFRGSLAEILGIILIALVFLRWRRVNCFPQQYLVSTELFHKWIDAWTEANGSIEKMLPSSSTDNQLEKS
ncbi:MAG: hypothetical protein SW833_19235 [Cyanobacteriota bacterium]|nr:hypothetical protein [Cyanobacteriota bacterium]